MTSLLARCFSTIKRNETVHNRFKTIRSARLRSRKQEVVKPKGIVVAARKESRPCVVCEWGLAFR